MQFLAAHSRSCCDADRMKGLRAGRIIESSLASKPFFATQDYENEAPRKAHNRGLSSFLCYPKVLDSDLGSSLVVNALQRSLHSANLPIW